MATREPSSAINRRSRTVCHRCHGKKIRCDLQERGRNASCSACAGVGVNCVIRPSHKGRHGKRQPQGGEVTRLQRESLPRYPDVIEDGACLGDTSLLGLFTRNQRPSGDRGGPVRESLHGMRILNHIPSALLQSCFEAYLEYSYAWCPVLDPNAVHTLTLIKGSALLQHALALLGSSFRTPVLPDSDAGEHYKRARALFYDPETRASPLERISACMLFHWWSSGPLTVVSLDGCYWWTGAAIRLAQGLGLHREPSNVLAETANQRRLMWWTLYARDRITAICQGRPCIIDEDYCDVRRPQVIDFPPDKLREGQVFVNWVQLSSILGIMNKHLFLSRHPNVQLPKDDISNRLIAWIRSLPHAVQLPIASIHSIPFDRNVHMLHLPYLAMITMMYFKRSDTDLPGASIAAVIAAACTSRIFEDFLARGSLKFLWGEAGWFIAMAVLALLHVLPLPKFTLAAASHIRILQSALAHMAKTRHSAKMFSDGIQNILQAKGLDVREQSVDVSQRQSDFAAFAGRSNRLSSGIEMVDRSGAIPWADFFPFVTADTSPLIAAILQDQHDNTSPEPTIPFELDGQLEDFWDDLIAMNDILDYPMQDLAVDHV